MDSKLLSQLRLALYRYSKATDISRELGISQPYLSRTLSKLGNELLRIGKGRSTAYYLRREIPKVGSEIVISEISENGSILKAGILIPVFPRGFFWHSREEAQSRHFSDLPYFLDDLRPSGFLGRLIPKTYPEWSFNQDVRTWSADEALVYLTNLGSDLIGNLILGENTLASYLSPLGSQDMGKPHKITSRPALYERLAEQVLSIGIPGSSAGGEYSKFQARRPSDGREVLVKFTDVGGGTKDLQSIRFQDLLLAEHFAFITYYKNTEVPYLSTVIKASKKLFLELERFDRTARGRRGLISLATLDAEFIGSGGSWSQIANKLYQQKIISLKSLKEIQERELYGNFIGNSDMHAWNLSFYYEQGKVGEPAPVYDMLPMRYMPDAGRQLSGLLEFPIPTINNLEIWDRAYAKGEEFWEVVSENSSFSLEFRKIAKGNLKKVGEFKKVRKQFQS